MATKEKWVELFEGVIGRKPSPEEFMAAKAVDFDLKSIQSIAGRSQKSSEQPTNSEITPEDIPGKEKVDEQAAFEPAQEYTLKQTSEQVAAPQEIWLTAFQEAFKRQPSPEEFQMAQSQGFSSIPIHSKLTEKNNPSQLDIKKDKKQIFKKKVVLSGLGLLILISLIGSFFYLSSVTGVKAVTDKFAMAIKNKNYDQVASLLSTDSDKWTRAEAKNLISYLNRKDINIETELSNIEKSNGESSFTDENDNQILGVAKTSKKFGIFQEYRMLAYPVKVRITTNLDGATIKPGDKETINLKKDTQIEIGDFHFTEQDFLLKGKTEIGNVETKIKLDLDKAKDNQLDLSLKSEKKQLNITMPKETSTATAYKIIVNGKEAGDSLSPEVQVIPDQELEVYANFSINDVSFTTNKEKVVAKDDRIEVVLTVSNDVVKRIKEVEASQKAKEEEKRKQEEKKAQISIFLSDYRSAVFDSVSSRSNYFSKYYDTSSAAYKEMVNWTTGGGVQKAKIDYYKPGALEIREVREEKGSYIVTTYEDFTVYYIDNTPNSVNRKNKVYYLKPVGNSFVIYDIQVSEE